MKKELKVALIAGAATIVAALIAVSWPKKPEPGGVTQTSSGNNAVQVGIARDVSVTTIQSTSPADVPCTERDLALSMEVEGDLIPGQRGGSGDRFASGRLYQFTLTNTSGACTAIVENIELSVLAGVKDQHPAQEATTATNQYEAIVSPEDVGRAVLLVALNGAPRTKWGYSYTPKSQPDRFAVHVIPKTWGHSYVVQFLVTWYDPKSAQHFRTRSPAYAAFFPEAKDPLDSLFSSTESWKFRESQRAVWAKELGYQVR